jgi:hypothetical protein
VCAPPVGCPHRSPRRALNRMQGVPPRFGTTISTAYPLVLSVMLVGRGAAPPKAGDRFVSGRNHPPRAAWGQLAPLEARTVEG